MLEYSEAPRAQYLPVGLAGEPGMRVSTSNQLDSDSLSVVDLVARLQDGDRDAAAELVRRHGALIRRRIRRSLPPRVRRMFDSQDILSTLYRRIDRLASEQMIRAQTPDEALGLLVRIAQNAVIDKARTVRRIDRIESLVAHLDVSAAPPKKDCETRREKVSEAIISEAFHILPDPDDRAILSLWLQGVDQTVIADTLGWKPSRVWWRWSRIRSKLAESMGKEFSA